MSEFANRNEIGEDLDRETSDCPDLWPDEEGLNDLDREAEAEKAADYARSCGFDKAADYISRHYDGGEFQESEPIPITTRNMDLAGQTSETGVPFVRRTADLGNGLVLEGVFPEFESRLQVDLGQSAKDQSHYQQFKACRDEFWDHMYDDPDTLKDMTIGDMERLEDPQGFAPEGWTWQHDPETGRFQLVDAETHRDTAHTGGSACW